MKSFSVKIFCFKNTTFLIYLLNEKLLWVHGPHNSLFACAIMPLILDLYKPHKQVNRVSVIIKIAYQIGRLKLNIFKELKH